MIASRVFIAGLVLMLLVTVIDFQIFEIKKTQASLIKVPKELAQKMSYFRKYYLKNREKLLKKRKQYVLENKDKIAEYQKKRYVENKERISQ